jgi:hypothetical protein
MHAGPKACCASQKEIVMRSCLAMLCLVCFPAVALAGSGYTIVVVNDTRSRIDTFAMAPAGSERWQEVNVTALEESGFDYAVKVQLHDDGGCFRDLRTTLADGRRIFARNFNVCQYHSYRPDRYSRHDHPGPGLLP